MDIPRPRPKLTWRDSPWWQATIQAGVSGLLMLAVAAPILLYLAAQTLPMIHQAVDLHSLLDELFKGTVLMLPYLWAYFFALERISRRNDRFSSSIDHQLPPIRG
jgi:hypothetical protein